MAPRNWPVLILAGFTFVLCVAQRAGADDAPPFTALFDTAVASAAPWSPEALVAKKGWAAVPEDTLTHAFAGDAAVMNDRVAVVLRRGAAGAELYTRAGEGSKQRAALVPLGPDGAGGTISGVKIIENTQASVMLEAVLSVRGGATANFRFRLTAGESLVEVRGAGGAGRLRVCDQAQYVVVPDFFADDMVFDPAALGEDRVGLPAENCLLGLCDEGRAIVACVWPSSRQNVDLLLSPAARGRGIAGYEIDLPAEGRLWVAVIEGAGVWHARRLTGEKPGGELALDWKPPMPARWRADVFEAGGLARSMHFADAAAGDEPDNGRGNGACRFNEGRPLVRLGGQAAAPSGVVVVYPVERTRTTPLTAFCLVDVIRNALGVGPCQYVLDAEGLGNSESSTPEQVTHWVERQYEKKPSKREVDTIREQLTRMTQQVQHTDTRIGQYVDFAAKVQRACDDYGRDAARAPAAAKLGAIARDMTAPAAVTFPVVQALAADVAAHAEGDDALANSRASLAAIRTAGAAQDYALAKLRMAARRLKQASRTLAAGEPAAAAFATQIRQQAEQMLVQK